MSANRHSDMSKTLLERSIQGIGVRPGLRVTLSDVLERVLTKGLILDADVVIVLAGVPLIGVKLRAAIAGMETMRRYGLMVDWDEKIREEYSTRRRLMRRPASHDSRSR